MKASLFLHRQIKEVQNDGTRAVRRKAMRVLGSILPVLAALPMVIAVRLMSPFFLIRFGYLIGKRIGHFAGNTELYLCKRDGPENGDRFRLDLFYCTSPVCNEYLRRMWKRKLLIFPFVRWLYAVNQVIPGGDKHTIELPGDKDTFGYIAQCAPHLAFTPDEERAGRQYLESINIREGDPFICFCSRDDNYLKAIEQHGDYSYHDYRNASIHSHVEAVEAFLENRSYQAIRMGYLSKEQIRTKNPKIIDYATNGDRTDFLDIYLSAKCHFFLNSGSGISALPRVFRRPLLATNLVPLALAPISFNMGSLTVFIPKKHWLIEEKRWMSFKECLACGFLKTHEYQQAGIEMVDNTPEEIADAMVETHARIRGVWEATDEDEALQRRFISLFKNTDSVVQRARIGARFLRQNRELLI